ncbi:hypothetical protein JCM1840_002618 [Sporobolomyces johnsonii]
MSASSSPCACVAALLPCRQQQRHPSEFPPSIEDLREGADLPAVEVLRILDPEHREPFVSLARIFLACGITPIEGLLRFELERPTYDCTLGGIAPFFDLWVSLKVARDVARELGVLDELAGLLEWETRRAWSVEDKEESGIVHNWKIASDRIAPQDYSTQSMLSATFPRLSLLPSGAQVRTLLPPMSTYPIYGAPSPATTLSVSSAGFPVTHDALWAKLVEWCVSEYEAWLESPPASPSSSAPSRPLSPQSTRKDRRTDDTDVDYPPLAPLFLYTSLVSLLTLTHSLPPSSSSLSTSSLTHLHPSLTLSRAELLPSPRASRNHEREGLDPSTLQKGTLYLVDAIARLAMGAHRADEVRKVDERRLRRRRKPDGEAKEVGGGVGVERDRGKDERIAEGWREVLERRVTRLEDVPLAVSGADTDQRPDPSLEAIGVLRSEVDALRSGLQRLESELARTKRKEEVLSMERREKEPRGWEWVLLLGAVFGVGVVAGGLGARWNAS